MKQRLQLSNIRLQATIMFPVDLTPEEACQGLAQTVSTVANATGRTELIAGVNITVGINGCMVDVQEGHHSLYRVFKIIEQAYNLLLNTREKAAQAAPLYNQEPASKALH